MEQDHRKREEYLKQLENIPKDLQVYLDESGIEQAICKDRGWGKIGEILKGEKSGKYYQRTNIVAGYVNRKTIAPFVFTGSCNTELFVKWVEDCLIKELTEGQTVIMDNASFHKSPKIKELIESVRCHLLYLPPYSPDLNPIEKFWANMKRWIKDKITLEDKLSDVIDAFFAVP